MVFPFLKSHKCESFKYWVKCNLPSGANQRVLPTYIAYTYSMVNSTIIYSQFSQKLHMMESSIVVLSVWPKSSFSKYFIQCIKAELFYPIQSLVNWKARATD